jgi:predicted Rdx family selenoprotein
VSDEVRQMFQERDEMIEIEEVPADNGVFDVALDGRMLYRKYDTGRFPQDGEITGLLRPLI